MITPTKQTMTAPIRRGPTGSFRIHSANNDTKSTRAKLSVIAVVNGNTATAQIPVLNARNAPINRTACHQGRSVFN